jgi:hypothetical protein
MAEKVNSPMDGEEGTTKYAKGAKSEASYKQYSCKMASIAVKCCQLTVNIYDFDGIVLTRFTA